MSNFIYLHSDILNRDFRFDCDESGVPIGFPIKPVTFSVEVTQGGTPVPNHYYSLFNDLSCCGLVTFFCVSRRATSVVYNSCLTLAGIKFFVQKRNITTYAMLRDLYQEAGYTVKHGSKTALKGVIDGRFGRKGAAGYVLIEEPRTNKIVAVYSLHADALIIEDWKVKTINNSAIKGV